MANPTTNFGWVMPTSTSLVTNLPADFNTFGQAVDTSMSELLGGTTGQVLSKTSNTNMDFTWVTPTDQTPLTTKGDLFTFTTVDARLAVGNNGETLVADSSTSTGLRYNANYAAGKNKIINGDFYVNQRNLTSQTTDGAYGFDRWRMYASSGGTYSAQTFTPGTAPVAGYEGKNFARIVTTGQSGASVYTSIDQPIEDVRTFAGQTITISFWAKAASGTPKVSIEVLQSFGSGGSGTTFTNGAAVTISTSWTRYSTTFSVPSITGATIGTGSNLDITFWVSAGTSFASRANSIGIQSNTFDFWGVQVEAGSVATAFNTATGTIQGELAACQRYYEVISGPALSGIAQAASAIYVNGAYKVVKRIDPTLTGLQTSVDIQQVNGGGYKTSTGSTYLFNAAGAQGTYGVFTVINGFTGLTADKYVIINETSDIISASAEL